MGYALSYNGLLNPGFTSISYSAPGVCIIQIFLFASAIRTIPNFNKLQNRGRFNPPLILMYIICRLSGARG